jgi:hypothetical protein
MTATCTACTEGAAVIAYQQRCDGLRQSEMVRLQGSVHLLLPHANGLWLQLPYA